MRNFLRDRGGWSILAVNIAVVLAFYFDDLDSRSVLLTYWVQGLIIGFFHYLRIMNIRKFSESSANAEVSDDDDMLRTTAGGFMKIYGFFHFIYLVFIIFIPIFEKNFPPIDVDLIVLSAAGFFVGHLLVFLRQLAWDKKQVVNLSVLASKPIIRIIPLHISIIAWGWWGMSPAFIIFLVLKVVIDTYLHKRLDVPENNEEPTKYI